ncbi:RcnB family protein [Phenylobacterium sp.]|uniref:RcnB family protein n=1 Tax=Phenylobacterium sp. TaxID=1871053 RepID=UPI003BAD58C8
MKTVIRGALALALLASTASAAFAQEDGGEHRRANRDDGGYNPAMRASTRNNPDNARPAPQPAAPAPAPAAPAAAPAPAPSGQSWQGGDRHRGPQTPPATTQPDRRGGGGTTWQGSGQRQGQGWQGQGWQNQSNDRRHDDRNDRNDRNDRGDRDRNWGDRGWANGGDRNWRPDRQPRPRYDQRHYGQTYRSHQRYRGYAYRPPSGFYIRSWSYGDMLPRPWWSSQYRLNDWWSYGLPIPPIGYEYVRVGDDVLLVDMFSGRVVQVIYDVFW